MVNAYWQGRCPHGVFEGLDCEKCNPNESHQYIDPECPRCRANARLIAAAPRMLELLRETHSLISDHFSVDNPLARAIYDVIRRDVEGESNG